MLESLFIKDLQAYNIINKIQVFSCEYFEIFKNIYFEEHPRAAASGLKNPASASATAMARNTSTKLT